MNIYQRITEGLSGASRAYKKLHRDADEKGSLPKAKDVVKIAKAIPTNPKRNKSRARKYKEERVGNNYTKDKKYTHPHVDSETFQRIRNMHAKNIKHIKKYGIRHPEH